jgi:hypothetical protein
VNATRAWRLPWTLDTAPHAVIDINRGCNLTCKACYNRRPAGNKPLQRIEEELRQLMGIRRLSSVSVVGGEPLLHPELPAILRLLKQHGLGIELCTNGLGLTGQVLRELAGLGTDSIFLHIESDQTRPDLAPGSGRGGADALRRTLVDAVAAAGIDPALSITARPDNLDEVADVIRLLVEHPNVNYLLVAIERDLSDAAPVRGSLSKGLRADAPRIARTDGRESLTNPRLAAWMRERFGYRPFAFQGSNLDRSDPRWLSYLVAAARLRDGSLLTHAMRASAFERAYIGLHRLVTGRYPMYRRQDEKAVAGQLILNALMGGDFTGNLGFLRRSRRNRVTLRAKRLVLQCPADVLPDGRVVHCVSCPDAVLQYGGLVPVCMCDNVVGGPPS